MKAWLLLLCLGSFWMMRGQDHKDSLIRKALDGGFMATAQKQYQNYRKDSALQQAPAQSFKAARILFINYYDNADTARAILEDFKNGLKPERIVTKHKLALHDDWDYAYALEPVFVKQYYNKVCIPTHLRLTREDLVFENRSHLTSSKQVKANTFFYNSDDNEIRLIYFTEAYGPHELPPLLDDALDYYNALTGSKAILFRSLYRLPADTLGADARLISDAWDHFPGQPSRPKDPGSKDSLAQHAYKDQKQAYDKAFSNWENVREQAFNARLKTDPALKKAFDRYLAFLKKYPVAIRSPAGRMAAQRLDLRDRVSAGYYRHRSMMYHGVYDNFIKPSTDSNIYSLFARSFFYLRLSKNEKALDSVKTVFYRSRTQMYLGALGATLLSDPGLFQRQSGGSLDGLRDEEKLQVMKHIEAWLDAKPTDELMMYYMGSIYQDLANDLSYPKSEIDYDEKLKAHYQSNRHVYYWLFDEEPEKH